MSTPAKIPALRLRVTATAETILRSGHPWLFAESVREQNRAGQLGELAVVYDRHDAFLAIGLFDPDSPLRVRLLHSGKPQRINLVWWQNRLTETVQRRMGLFDAQTTGYRWINGESDGWPGLVLDRYDTTLVLKLYTAAWLPRLDEIATLISNLLPSERSVLRLSRNIQQVAQSQFKLSDGQILRGPPLADAVIFRENGLCFEADVARGQKTGFFLDQRENRLRVEALSQGRDVLNAFSFSGGFSVYAARGGARSVTDLDISNHALESARRNFALNKTNVTVEICRHETIQTDAFEWIAGNAQRKFDLIVLDPPSLAKREAERAGAIQAYGKLARHAIRQLNSGGILVAASCSAHVSADEFFAMFRETARRSGRKFAELQTTYHAPDHPATFREAQYLKCIYLQFEAA
ncbi:MAG: class I SAM-dependent methyltransferase [Verrucomicrobiota bacterium]